MEEILAASKVTEEEDFLSKPTEESNEITQNVEASSEDMSTRSSMSDAGNLREIVETEVREKTDSQAGELTPNFEEASNTNDEETIEGKFDENVLVSQGDSACEMESSVERMESNFDVFDISMVALLRGTINELEHALRDSRSLLKSREEDIVNLRKEVEKGREQIHKEQMKWQRKSTKLEERGREIQELTKKLHDSEKTVEELSERIKEFESSCSESDDIVACCSSMKELLELKMKLMEKDATINGIRKNNHEQVLENAIVPAQQWKGKQRIEGESHEELKLKFLRDAFFYFMIDFHSDEQMKAILAVLSYGDQREDVIYRAYRMRQRGKKFAVKEVSSRGLSFLHEES